MHRPTHVPGRLAGVAAIACAAAVVPLAALVTAGSAAAVSPVRRRPATAAGRRG
jgi:hypothetical protein